MAQNGSDWRNFRLQYACDCNETLETPAIVICIAGVIGLGSTLASSNLNSTHLKPPKRCICLSDSPHYFYMSCLSSLTPRDAILVADSLRSAEGRREIPNRWDLYAIEVTPQLGSSNRRRRCSQRAQSALESGRETRVPGCSCWPQRGLGPMTPTCFVGSRSSL